MDVTELFSAHLWGDEWITASRELLVFFGGKGEDVVGLFLNDVAIHCLDGEFGHWTTPKMDGTAKKNSELTAFCHSAPSSHMTVSKNWMLRNLSLLGFESWFHLFIFLILFGLVKYLKNDSWSIKYGTPRAENKKAITRVASLAVGAGTVTWNMPGSGAPPVTALCHI